MFSIDSNSNLFPCSCKEKLGLQSPSSKNQDFRATWTMGLVVWNTQWLHFCWYSVNSKTDLAQEEAIIIVSVTMTCRPSAPTSPPSITSLLSRKENLPLATFLLPHTMFPFCCYTQQNFSWANVVFYSWSTSILAMENSGMHQRPCKVQDQGQSYLHMWREDPTFYEGNCRLVGIWHSTVSKTSRNNSLKSRNVPRGTIRTGSI